eukprot:COSAG06_NODE_5202_length_3642_cov_9.712955_2_plen_70_part_00
MEIFGPHGYLGGQNPYKTARFASPCVGAPRPARALVETNSSPIHVGVVVVLVVEIHGWCHRRPWRLWLW